MDTTETEGEIETNGHHVTILLMEEESPYDRRVELKSYSEFVFHKNEMTGLQKNKWIVEVTSLLRIKKLIYYFTVIFKLSFSVYK